MISTSEEGISLRIWMQSRFLSCWPGLGRLVGYVDTGCRAWHFAQGGEVGTALPLLLPWGWEGAGHGLYRSREGDTKRELGSARWCGAGDRYLRGWKPFQPAWALCSHLRDRSSKTEAGGFDSYYFYFLIIHMHEIGIHSIIVERWQLKLYGSQISCRSHDMP